MICLADKNIQINIKSENKATPNIDKVLSSLKGLHRGIDTVNSGMAGFTDSLRSYNNAMSGINSMFRSTMREAADIVIGFTSDAIKGYSELEQQHAKTLGAMASDYGKTASEQQKLIDNGEKLKQQAIEISRYGSNGRGSLVNPTEISSAQTALVKSGKTANQIMNKNNSGKTPVDIIVEFAKGNDLEMETAVDFAVTLGEQFDYSMDKWGEMLDKVSHAADTSIIEVVDIVNSMKYAGGIASGLDRPMEEVLTMLSVMGNSGLKGSIAGTGVQAFFTRLLASGTTVTDSALDVAPGDAAQSYIDFYTSVVDANGDLTDMDTVLGELDSAMEELNDEEQTWFARKVFSLFQMKAAYALTGSDDSDVFKDIMTDITNNSTGTNAIKYNYQLSSQAGRIEALKIAWESTKTDIGDRMSPLVTAISDETLAYLQNNGKYNINMDTIEKAIDTSRKDIQSAYGSDVADFISGMATGVVNAGMIGEALLPQVGGIGGAFVKIFNGDIGGAFDELSTSLSNTNTNIEELPDDLQDMAEAVRNVIIALTALAAINTASNVITSASTIWGVTGGALLGAGAKGIAGLGAGASSYGIYKAVSSAASATGRSSNKLYANGMGGLDTLAELIFKKNEKLSKYGGWDPNAMANAKGDLTPRMERAKSLYEDIDALYKSADVADREALRGKINTKIETAQKIDQIIKFEKDLKSRQDFRSKITDAKLGSTYDDDTARLADTVYTLKNNLTQQETLMLTERSNADKLLNARKPITKTNDYKFQTNTDEIVDSANGDMQWYKKKQDKVIQSNVVDYVSPEEKVDEIIRNSKLVETTDGITRTMDKLDDATEDLLKRKVEENVSIAKKVAKENDSIKATEEIVRSQKAASKSYQQVTTDLINVAKKSKEVVNTKTATSGMSKAVDTIISSTTSNTISDDLLKSAQRVSDDLNKIKKIDGVPESAFKSIDDSIKSIDDVIKRMDGIAKKSATINSGTKINESVNAIDDIIDSARTLLKTNSKETLSGFSKKYGISMRTILDYLNDAKASGKSGDDILRSLEDGPEIMAKHIADVYGTTEELASATWASISKGNKFKMIAGGIGKTALNVGGEISFGVLQDIIFENTHKMMNKGKSSLDLMDDMFTGLWDPTSIFTGTDNSYLGKSNLGLKAGFRNGNTPNSSMPNDSALVNAIIGGLGTVQGQVWTATGYKKGSMYYERDANGQPKETGLASTYGYIDGLMRSLYSEYKDKGLEIPLSNIATSTQTMVDALHKDMADRGLTEADANGIMSPRVLTDTYNAIREQYQNSNKSFSGGGGSFGRLQFGGGSDILNRISSINSMVSNPSLKVDFKPNLSISVRMSSTGKVLGTTVTMPDYDSYIKWSSMQQSKVAPGIIRQN